MKKVDLIQLVRKMNPQERSPYAGVKQKRHKSVTYRTLSLISIILLSPQVKNRGINLLGSTFECSNM